MLKTEKSDYKCPIICTIVWGIVVLALFHLIYKILGDTHKSVLSAASGSITLGMLFIFVFDILAFIKKKSHWLKFINMAKLLIFSSLLILSVISYFAEIFKNDPYIGLQQIIWGMTSLTAFDRIFNYGKSFLKTE